MFQLELSIFFNRLNATNPSSWQKSVESKRRKLNLPMEKISKNLSAGKTLNDFFRIPLLIDWLASAVLSFASRLPAVIALALRPYVIKKYTEPIQSSCACFLTQRLFRLWFCTISLLGGRPALCKIHLASNRKPREIMRS